MKKPNNVKEYIELAPAHMRPSLNQLRALIKKIAPTAEERLSYGMPYYDYRGRLVYFAAQKDYVGLYIPPPIIANHAEELESYVTTKSAIHLPVNKFPKSLITKLIKARMKHNELRIEESQET